MKHTPLYEAHVKEGGKIVDFAGFAMPVQYESVIAEHLAVREKAGLFDVSHMGRFFIRGKDAQKFVSYITTNNPFKLDKFQAQYSLMCYPEGGIVDDLLVYKIDDDQFFLVVNAANTEKDWKWIEEQKNNKKEWDIIVEDATERLAQIAIQGPLSEAITKKIIEGDIESLGYYRAINAKYKGREVFISRTGYTGEDGFEIYFDNDLALELWEDFRKEGVKPCGLGARDTLRLEMKFALYGNDIDSTTNPVEAGLLWVVDLTKEDFIGKDAILKIKEEKPERKLIAIVMKEKGVPRHGYKIYINDDEIGFVTSGTFSPSLKKGIAMGYVKRPYNKIGTELFIDIRGRQLFAEVIKPPFYKNASHK